MLSRVMEMMRSVMLKPCLSVKLMLSVGSVMTPLLFLMPRDAAAIPPFHCSHSLLPPMTGFLVMAFRSLLTCAESGVRSHASILICHALVCISNVRARLLISGLYLSKMVISWFVKYSVSAGEAQETWLLWT